MKKIRRAHLWIGLIASVFLFMEAITGLIMMEPWLIGQSDNNRPFADGQAFQGGNFNRGQGFQGNTGSDSGLNSQNGQGFQRRNGSGFPGGGFPNGRMRGERDSGSLMGIIKGLHAGRLGNMDIGWLIDLAATSMIFLTGSGIFLSWKILSIEKKRKQARAANLDTMPNE